MLYHWATQEHFKFLFIYENLKSENIEEFLSVRHNMSNTIICLHDSS